MGGGRKVRDPLSAPPVLSIGAVLDSDAESSAWKLAINALSKQVISLRESVQGAVRVNVVFHIDSKFTPNEFVGVRTGRFSKKDSHLLVQAAVPSGSANDRRAVLLALLSDAVDEAEIFVRKRRIADDLDYIRAVVEGLPTE